MEESYDLLIGNGLLLVSPLATQAIVLHHVETANLNQSDACLLGLQEPRSCSVQATGELGNNADPATPS